MSVECANPDCGRDDFESERAMKIHHKLAHGESLRSRGERRSVPVLGGVDPIGKIEETDPETFTVAVVPYDLSEAIEHTRISAKFETSDQENLEYIVFRHFFDDEWPHPHHAIGLDPARLDEYIDGLEIARMDHMMGDP